jgi:hypothetical protein
MADPAATWTRSTIDEIRVVADTTAFRPAAATEQRIADRRSGHGDQVGRDNLRTGHVLYLLT